MANQALEVAASLINLIHYMAILTAERAYKVPI